jgi:hypothetical protein
MANTAEKHSLVVQLVAVLHSCVPWMCVEQLMSLSSFLAAEENLRLSVCRGKKNLSLVEANAGDEARIWGRILLRLAGIEVLER